MTVVIGHCESLFCKSDLVENELPLVKDKIAYEVLVNSKTVWTNLNSVPLDSDGKDYFFIVVHLKKKEKCVLVNDLGFGYVDLL